MVKGKGIWGSVVVCRGGVLEERVNGGRVGGWFEKEGVGGGGVLRVTNEVLTVVRD